MLEIAKLKELQSLNLTKYNKVSATLFISQANTFLGDYPKPITKISNINELNRLRALSRDFSSFYFFL